MLKRLERSSKRRRIYMQTKEKPFIKKLKFNELRRGYRPLTLIQQ